MIYYIGRKVFTLLLTLYLIITATFLLMKVLPGDPFTQEQGLPQETLTALRAHYGLDDAWYWQYLRYLQSVATWDLGPSLVYQDRTVNDIIREGFPVSAILGVEALLFSVGIGVSLGTVAALRHHRWQDYAAVAFSAFGISVPSFLLATLLQYVFAVYLGWLPLARWGTVLHTILPALSLAALPTAYVARLTRSSLLEVLECDYIKGAKAKGLSSLAVICRHALPNALVPVVTYLGPLTANVFVGSFVVERIFGIPGLGQWFVLSVANRDYTVIMGTTVFYAILLLVAMFLVDLVYGFLDPRIMRDIYRKQRA